MTEGVGIINLYGVGPSMRNKMPGLDNQAMNCFHCGGVLVFMDTLFDPVMCSQCECMWETRSVLVMKGQSCADNSEQVVRFDDGPKKDIFQ
jgi:hypothetical protein